MMTLSRSKFFSLQADGSTDAGNIDEELFLVLHFVHVHDSFFTVRQLSRGTAKGLFDCLKRAVEYMELQTGRPNSLALAAMVPMPTLGMEG